MGIEKICSNITSDQMLSDFLQASKHQNVKKLKIEDFEQIEQVLVYKYEEGSKGILFSNSGVYYEGDIIQNKMEGKGMMKTVLDEVYEGNFQNSLAHGKGVYQNNKIIFEGRWKNGRPESGTIQIKHTNSSFEIDSIQLDENTYFQTGIIKIRLGNHCYYDGFISKTNEFYCFEGSGTMLFEDGSRYRGQWKNGKMEGKGQYYWSDQIHKYIGQYKNGLKHGFGKYYTKKNEYYEGNWVEGRKQGRFLYKEKYGNETRVLYEDDFYESEKENSSTIIDDQYH